MKHSDHPVKGKFVLLYECGSTRAVWGSINRDGMTWTNKDGAEILALPGTFQVYTPNKGFVTGETVTDLERNERIPLQKEAEKRTNGYFETKLH
jgi:hypothetical protein